MDEDTEGTTTEETTEETSSTEETRTLTAEEIDKMVARAADRGSRKAVKDLAIDLGFEGTGTLKEWVKAQQTKQEEEESDLEKELREAQRKATEADQAKASLAAERLDLAIQRQILRAAVADPKRAGRIATIIKAELPPDLEETDWETVIDDAIELVRKDTPELFGKPAGHGSGDGGDTGGSTTDADEQDETYRKEYAARGLITGPTA